MQRVVPCQAAKVRHSNNLGETKPDRGVENESLVADLLEWLLPMSRPYEEVMAAWRTTCPRLTIWEDASDAGYVVVRDGEVFITAAGREFLGRVRWVLRAHI
jgi:hypothetical protein